MKAGRFEIRVPGSTSNLGPGFDCLGLAVDRYLHLRWTEEGDGSLVLSGERPPTGLGDRLSGGLDVLGLPAGGGLEIRSSIPVGRGLGSSAALGVALTALHAARSGGEIRRRALLDAVASEEGHPDNAAPSLLGGLVASSIREGVVSAVPLPLSDRIGWAWASPGRASETATMRDVLPDRVDRDAAVRNAARLAHLIPALAAGDGDVIAWAMEDELHVPVRLPLIVGGRAAHAAALEAGAWACTISGAGSGLIAAAPRERVGDVVEAMAEAFRESDPGPSSGPSARPSSGPSAGPAAGPGVGLAFELRPDLEGARWGERVGPDPAPLDAPPTRRG